MTPDQAQAAIVAILKECGVSAVLISADGKHNRNTREASNGGGGVFYAFGNIKELYAVKPKGPMVQREMFE